MSRSRCPWDSRRVARRAKQVVDEAPAGATVTLWRSGHVTLEAPGFAYQALYGDDRLYPLRTWRFEVLGRRPYTYELLRDIRQACGRPAPLPGL